VLSDPSIVEEWWNFPPFNDEPKYWHLCAQLSRSDTAPDADENDDTGSVAGASSLSFDQARNRLAGECVERFALRPLGPGEYAATMSFAVAERQGAALGRHEVVCGVGLHPTDSAVVRWVKGIDVRTRDPLAVPAQLVYVPHVFDEDESVLRAPISTGAAAHTNFEMALFTGLLECVERDAFTYAWYRQSTLTEVSLMQLVTLGGSDLRRRLDACRRYLLQPRCFLLPTDVDAVTAVMCVLCDSTGIGPEVTVAAKASTSVVAAAAGALDEAHQIRCWMRRVQDAGAPAANPPLDRLHDRALYWLRPGPAKDLLAWLDRSIHGDIEPSDGECAGLDDGRVSGSV